MEEGLRIIVRDMQPNDKEFIMDSWLKGQYNGSPYWSQMPIRLFYQEYTKRIEEILTKATVKVAVMEEGSETIIGFSVHSGNTLHWVYTKLDYRSQGIMRLLTKNLTIEAVSSTTLPGASITKKKKLSFNPFRK